MDREAAVIRAASRDMGYSALKPQQEMIVRHFLSGRDVFVSLPTGSGKSLCYTLLPMVFDRLKQPSADRSLVIVVSPLMKDQVRSLLEKNVRSAYVSDVDECSDVYKQACNGELSIIFISPESLLCDPKWRDILQSPIYQQNLVAFVVDEAHCVIKW